MTRKNDCSGQKSNEIDQRRFSIGREQNPSMAIVWALAEVTGRDVEQIKPLYDSIDPGALDRLLGDSPRVRVTFEHLGHPITVVGEGTEQYLKIGK